MSTSSKVNIIFVMIFGGIFLVSLYKKRVVEIDLIKEKFEVTSGNIISFKKRLPKNIIPPKYNYSIKSKIYKGGFVSQKICKELNVSEAAELKRVNFPVVYSVNKREVSRMLIRPKDFKEFGLSFPDSLQSIYVKYFKDCE